MVRHKIFTNFIPINWLNLFRFKEFDTSTPEGRSKERYRRAGLTAVASALAKIITILTMLVSVPLTLNYLGAERYGLWMTINSMVFMIGFTDLGMGLGLMNALSEAHGQDDREAAVVYTSSGFFMLMGMGTLLVIFFSLAYPYIPWPKLFNVPSGMASREAGPAMAIFFMCFAANLPLGVVQRVQRAYQEGFINSLWECLSKILGLLGLLLIIYLKAGLVWLVLAVAGAPLLAALGNGSFLFTYSRPWLCPRWQKITTEAAGKIFRLGLFFFILQFASAVSLQSHNFILAQILGPEAVTQYAIPARLFWFLPMILNFFFEPLWPAYGEAIARNEIAWVKKTFYRSMRLGLIFSIPATTILVILSPQILHLWVGSKIDPSWSLLIALGLWNIIMVLGVSLSMMLNAANIFRLQIICLILVIFIGLPLSIILVYLIGIPGVIYGTVIAYLILFILPIFFYINKFFRSWNSSEEYIFTDNN